MKNKLFIIGFAGIKKYYFNLTEEKSVRKYCLSNNIIYDEKYLDFVKVVEFDDEIDVSVVCK